ncbi:hypothetical protein [Candidatus Lokiarchaeum ossiferum]|uniref:hypothetical protein n=1 Tax=Candidatus Lokiarchaeum ossiferum TaxID=2951803 RepID=UPI00352C5CB2
MDDSQLLNNASRIQKKILIDNIPNHNTGLNNFLSTKEILRKTGLTRSSFLRYLKKYGKDLDIHYIKKEQKPSSITLRLKNNKKISL